ncbi:alcohol dehydrogenase zinc-binding domain-containing protein [Sporocytophaga myxococcoides]|uniref:Alcohol dehydrogenase zinc-binding domain-containing protein n=1 Tax=Sporocytophaga myxococcoides TaxID=153721 RepID=A0A098LI50_9BACT|nr:NADP-dependent oxidoreductase [Sporocytophaga myxococcoides]GAL86645.1 alcohol dehydrogenase zinc-binding domain-containing protein [Sporocytophaga myxococcoides]
MKAYIINEFGGPEKLISTNIKMPSPGKKEVLIEVKSFSINPVDVKTRSGKGLAGRFKDKLPLILGWDISGIVREVGEEVTKFANGDAVFGMVNFPGLASAYAQYVVAPEDHITKKPSNITHEEAAGATLALLTAWQALVTNAKVKSGQKVLIHSAAGGVGHYAVQIAKYLGAYVIGTSSAENRDFVLGLGADEHIDYKTQRFEDIVKDADFVLDTMGGDNALRSLLSTKKGGTVISIPSGLQEGLKEKAEELGTNAYNFLVASNGKDMEELAKLLEKGIIKSHISKTFSFDDIQSAHKQIETGKTRGKVVVIL